MQAIESLTVRDIAANSLAAVRIFEKLGIDYCCGGKRPLAAACHEKGYDPAAVQAELDQAMAEGTDTETDWSLALLKDLVDYIVQRHHGYLRRELPAIQHRLDKVFQIYNQRFGPTLIGLPEVFATLRAELESHLGKEERLLFPAVVAYESAAAANQPLPASLFGSVRNPIAAMEAEHEVAGQALREIRRITRDFETPDSACVTFRALMNGLRELERDLHMHIHLENNILFQRAEQLEATLPASRLS